MKTKKKSVNENKGKINERDYQSEGITENSTQRAKGIRQTRVQRPERQTEGLQRTPRSPRRRGETTAENQYLKR